MPKPLLCDPALLSRDLSGRRYVVTGANAGLGYATSHRLAALGAEVWMLCRDRSAAPAPSRG